MALKRQPRHFLRDGGALDQRRALRDEPRTGLRLGGADEVRREGEKTDECQCADHANLALPGLSDYSDAQSARSRITFP